MKFFRITCLYLLDRPVKFSSYTSHQASQINKDNEKAGYTLSSVYSHYSENTRYILAGNTTACSTLQVNQIVFLKKIISFLSIFTLFVSILIASNNAIAGTTENVVEGAGELTSFGISVLEDFGEGKTAEESGKARLEDLLKGKTKDYIKNKLTGGSDLSEGMGLILNEIFNAIDTKSRQRANACTTAAYNQAWGIAFDAKNTRLLRGAANVWFDVLTSIPGAPGLAEKLVTETGKLAYSKIKSEIEGKIKEWWAKQKDESFKLTKQSGPCSITLTVLWNKKKNKYLFLISGKCDCKLVPIEPLGRGGTITMKSFQIIGGGNVSPEIDLKDPKNPKVKINAGRVTNIKDTSDCNCAGDESRLPPPKEDPISEWITAPRMEARVTKAKCEACQPLLDTAIGLVGDFNKLADRMDALGKLILAEKYKTPDRDANIKEWEELSKQQDDIQKKHDDVFIKFAKCEEEECKLGTESFQLPHTSELSKTSTSCEACQSIVDEINALVDKHNIIAGQMNALADAARRAEMKHGTVEGNKTYKKWHELSKQTTDLSNQVAKKQTEKSQCEASNCFGVKPFQKIKLTSACDACSDIQVRLNKVEKEYNDHVDYVNGLWKDFQDFLVKGGDRGSKEATDLSGKARKEGDKFEEMWDRMDKLQKELRACDPDKCDVAEDGSKIKIGEDFEHQMMRVRHQLVKLIQLLMSCNNQL